MTTITPNMGLTNNDVGVTPGPDWAVNENGNNILVDQHNHTAGKGELIPVTGLSITQDFPINGNNVNNARSYRMQNNGSTLTGPQDINCLNVFNGECYFNDAHGVAVQLTSGGVINNPSVNFFNPTTISTNTTITNSNTFNMVEVVTASTAIQITLPAVSSVANGRFYYFKDTSNNAKANNITLIRNGSDTFDGVSGNLIINTNLGGVLIVGNHVSNWMVFYFIPKLMLDGTFGTTAQNVVLTGNSVFIEAVSTNQITIGANGNSVVIPSANLTVSASTVTTIGSNTIELSNSSGAVENRGTLHQELAAQFDANVTIGSSGGATTTVIGFNSSDTLTVNAVPTFETGINLIGNINSTATTGSNAFSGNMSISKDFAVGQNVTVTGNLHIETNTQLDGTLTATGNTALAGTLTVTGNGTFNGSLNLINNPRMFSRYLQTSAASGSSFGPQDGEYIVVSGLSGTTTYLIDASNAQIGDTITFINQSAQILTIGLDASGSTYNLAAFSGSSSTHDLVVRWATFAYLPSATSPKFSILNRSSL
jgi:hypothetical protein